MYKGLNGLLELPMDQFQQKSDRMKTRQSGEQVYTIPRSNVDSHMYPFFPSTLRLWNEQLTNLAATLCVRLIEGYMCERGRGVLSSASIYHVA